MNAKVAGYTVDALFPDHKVIVELDSWAYHRDRHTFEARPASATPPRWTPTTSRSA